MPALLLLSDRDREIVRLFVESASDRLHQRGGAPFVIDTACVSYRPVSQILRLGELAPITITSQVLDVVAAGLHQEFLLLWRGEEQQQQQQ